MILKSRKGLVIISIITLFKIILLSLFSSEYSESLFIPFVKIFIEGNLNPWQYYFENGLNSDAFPYHPLMLYLLTPSMFLIKFFSIENIIISNLIFKLPLFVADLVILFTFLRLFPLKKKKVFLYYFCNPIIIYAIYIHSQLDIIPMALLFVGIYFLTLDKLKLSSLLIGLALVAKLHILITIPLLFFYLLKKHKIKDVIAYFSIILVVFILLDFPYILSEGFQQMVLFNSKQSLLFDSYLNIGKMELLLPIVSILMVYIHFFNQKRVNQDLLFFYFGVLFTATLFFIYPAPAWYVWLVPFISIYYINNENEKKTRLFYAVFSVVYLIFFIIFYQPDYKDILYLGNEVNFKFENVNLSNISFTLLLSMLLAVMYAFYKYGIKSNSIYKKQSNLIIGIGGDSGVGKTTLLNNLQNVLGNKLLQIEGDGEHKWERGDDNWNKFTHLDPKANNIHKQSEAINSLKNNEIIFRSDYNHIDGKFSELKKIIPKEFIVISGLHPFYLPKQRKNIDFKIYIDTEESIRRHWKIIRDTKKRGYSIQKIMEQIENRVEDAKKYIYPQKEFADMIIKYYPTNTFKLGEQNETVNLGLKITFDANIYMDDLFNNLNCPFISDYNNDLKSQYIEIETSPQLNFEDIAMSLIENISEIIPLDIKWGSGYEGLIQLISLKMISEKLK
ncbi:hypothetical protein N8351_00280 [Flavobacteriaceae bacterium]|nr:hypothetical protein [Flavobacteriaceae bacterium]